MTAAQLRLLRVLPVQLRPNQIQQLHVAEIRVPLQHLDERPAERPTRFAVLEGIGSVFSSLA